MTLLAKSQPKRDRWGRPLIVPADGGKAKAYDRISGMSSAVDDRYALELWGKRMVAQGLTMRPDLIAEAVAAKGDKQTLNRVAEAAIDAAKGDAAARMGTALHSLCEQLDAGDLDLSAIPGDLAADVRAYETCIREAGIQILEIEQFVVCEALGCAGTLDRLMRLPDGRIVVGDIKTGQSVVEFGAGSAAIQVAIYANAETSYDLSLPEPHTHRPRDLDKTVGILIALPAGSGTCTLHELDLVAGWEAAQMARQVKTWRKRKDLARPYESVRPGYFMATNPVSGSKFEAPLTIGTSTTGKIVDRELLRHVEDVEVTWTDTGASALTVGGTKTPSADTSATTTSFKRGGSKDKSPGSPGSSTSPTRMPPAREWLQERYWSLPADALAAFKAHAKLHHMVAFDKADAGQLDALEALLVDVERDYSVPFAPAPQDVPAGPAVALLPENEGRSLVTRWHALDVDSPAVTTEDVDAIAKRLKALPQDADALGASFQRQARDAGLDLRLKVKPTERRFAVMRALCLLLEAGCDEAVIRTCIWHVANLGGSDASTGRCLALLTQDEAQRLGDLALALGETITIQYPGDILTLVGDLSPYAA